MPRKGKKVIELKPKIFKYYGEGTCLYCGKKLVGKQVKYCCQKHGEKYRKATREKKIIHWKQFRNYILDRHNHTCFECNKHKRELEQPLQVHHIIPISHGGREFDENNCVVLCFKCHGKIHW